MVLAVVMATKRVGDERVGVGILVVARLVLYTLSLLENIPQI